MPGTAPRQAPGDYARRHYARKETNLSQEPNTPEGTEPTEDASTATPEVMTTNQLAKLELDLRATETELEAAKLAITEAGAKGDIAGMLAAGEKVKAGQAKMARCKTAIEQLTFEAKGAERTAASEEITNSVNSLLEIMKDELDRYRGLSLIGFEVEFNAEGDATVKVNSKAFNKQAGDGKPRTESATAGGTVEWHYNGGTFKAREFLLGFGGEDGAAAVDKVDNWKALGLKHSPGFDTAVKKLAKELGATGFKNGVQIAL